jgi:hypothetical protein
LGDGDIVGIEGVVVCGGGEVLAVDLRDGGGAEMVLQGVIEKKVRGDVVAVGGSDVGHRKDAVVFAMEGVMVVVAAEGGAVVVIVVAIAVVMLFAGHAEAHDVAVMVMRDGSVYEGQHEGQRRKAA